MEYPAFIKHAETDPIPAAYVQNEAEHHAQLIGWGHPGLPGYGDEKEALQKQLDAAGVDYDKRWGVERLKQAVTEIKPVEVKK